VRRCRKGLEDGMRSDALDNNQEEGMGGWFVICCGEECEGMSGG
jgi:hypothetical protein